MPIDTVAALIEALRQSRLLDTPQLTEVEQTLQPRCADARALARELLQRGWATAFQVNQLMQGRAADLVLGQYVLLERLGEGGMGQVFKARHRMMNRTVALKLIRNEVITHPQSVRRFRQEIEAAAKLSHPNIVIAHDANEVDGKHFLTMEYVDGTDLSKLVKQQGPVPADRACDYVRQAALGLQHAHERGLVHRDIKPSNLLLTTPIGTRAGGTIKLLDMGLARLMGDNGSGGGPAHELTKAGTLVGTADYMAPEQAVDSHQADIRADIYSLGCTLYYLLTGQPPFPHGTVMQKLFSHNQEEPRPVEQLRVDLPDGLGPVVRRMMAKAPQDRYQTPGETAAALAPFCTAPETSPPTVQDAEPGAIQRFPAVPQAVLVQNFPGSSLLVGAAPAALNIQQRLAPRRRGWLLVAGLALGIVILGGVAWAIIGLRGTPGAQTTTVARTEPKSDPDKFTNSIGMQMVRIPAGKFLMGSPDSEKLRNALESPQHEVTISKPFYMGAHEVTVGQFRAFANATKFKTWAESNGQGAGRYNFEKRDFEFDPQCNWQNPGWKLEGDHPVVCVSWNDARSFCEWLTQTEGRTYRLPTEAEWEYACRAGTTTPNAFGTSLSSFQANFNGNVPYGGAVRGPKLEQVTKVGSFKKNAFGLYDMHGNAAEWTADYMGPYIGGAQTDPTGPIKGQQDRRVVRGASWPDPGQFCRSAFRTDAPASYSCSGVGFRVVCPQ
jgi:formylglycine-generating enzyme required for sulfatase activity/tRNA A-37 threonylcarbamoyl transferase component Bud32